MNSKDIIIKEKGWELIDKTSLRFAHSLNLGNIQKQLKEIDFNDFYNSIGGKNARNENLENFKIPPMVFEYYKSLCITGKIPTLEKLINNYINTYCEKISDKLTLKKAYIKDKNIIFNKEDLMGRICRAYNSYNREVELLAKLIKFSKVYNKDICFYYSFKEDYYNGLDIIVVYNNEKYGICSYTSGKNSLKYKSIKNNVRHHYDIKHTFDIVSYFSGENKNTIRLGDIDVYNDNSVKDLLKKIIN